jgi:hypothetical protein
MIVRAYGFNVRNRPATIALAAVALSLGAVFLAFGIVLLLGLAAVGAVIGTGAFLVRSLTRRRFGPVSGSRADHELDPALEVFPVDQAASKPLLPHEPTTPRANRPG